MSQKVGSAPHWIEATAVAGQAVVLTLPAPTNGSKIYLVAFYAFKLAADTLVAGAAPVLITTTGLPGSLTIPVSAEALAKGARTREAYEPSIPLAASEINTPVVFTAPAGTNVVWQLGALYYT